MDTKSTRHCSYLLGAICATMSMMSQADAQSFGFRIETDVYHEGVKAPTQQTVTLFANGIAYDMSQDDSDSEITMVNPMQDQMVLLDRTHKIQTEFKISELKGYFEAGKRRAMAEGLSPLIQNADKVVAHSDRIIVGGKELMQYEATMQSPEDNIRSQQFSLMYRQFADAAKYLNSFRLHGEPPFTRLALNEQLQSRNVIPKEIILRILKGKENIQVTCRLIADWKLTEQDDLKITQIGVDKFNFKTVTPAEYQSITSEKVAQK